MTDLITGGKRDDKVDDEDDSLLGYNVTYSWELDRNFTGAYYLHHQGDQLSHT
jgi:hypothetical protein